MLGSSVATAPDLLRLLTIPYFGYIAYRDIRTRRVPNRLLLPLAGLAVVLLVWELLTLGSATALERRRFFLRVAFSVGFVIPLSYLSWWLGGFGGGDMKVFSIIAVLFPTFPEYRLGAVGVDMLSTVPVVETTIGVFSLTILTNTVFAGAVYPALLAVKNAVTGYRSPWMFVAMPIQWDQATSQYGSLIGLPDRRLTDSFSMSGLQAYFSLRGLDLDALRMYLSWRGCSLAELRETSDLYRDPASLPSDPNPPGDGMIVTDGGTNGDNAIDSDVTDPTDGDYDDPWGAEAFLDSIDGSAYGTTPQQLREGLETLTSDDIVWISPGIPFLVPFFIGLLISVTYGDALSAVLVAAGVV